MNTSEINDVRVSYNDKFMWWSLKKGYKGKKKKLNEQKMPKRKQKRNLINY